MGAQESRSQQTPGEGAENVVDYYTLLGVDENCSQDEIKGSGQEL